MQRSQAEQLGAHCATLEAELVALRAGNPPGVVEDLRARVAHAEARADDAAELMENARREAASWKTKARQLIASQRLAELHGGGGGGSGGGGGGSGGRPAVPTWSDGGDRAAAAKEEIARLKAAAAHWRGEAAHEIARQRAFAEAVWASDAFTQTQKQRIGALLRAAGGAGAPAPAAPSLSETNGPAWLNGPSPLT